MRCITLTAMECTVVVTRSIAAAGRPFDLRRHPRRLRSARRRARLRPRQRCVRCCNLLPTCNQSSSLSRRVYAGDCTAHPALYSLRFNRSTLRQRKTSVVFEPVLAPLADVFGCAAIVRAVPSTFLFVGFFIRRFDEPGPLIRRRAGRIDWHAHRWTLDAALLQVREG